VRWLHLEPGVLVRADPSRVEQIVRNLLCNAVKYGKGKPVEVMVQSGPGEGDPRRTPRSRTPWRPRDRCGSIFVIPGYYRLSAMPRDTVKIAVSLPNDLFQAVESERKRAGKNRSAAVQEALREWLRSRSYAQLVREYEAGYAAMPEGPDEIEAAMRTALDLLAADDDW